MFWAFWVYSFRSSIYERSLTQCLGVLLKFDLHLVAIIKLKFIYSEKATTFCKISILLLSYVVPVKSTGEILQNVVAFSEYMSFIKARDFQWRWNCVGGTPCILIKRKSTSTFFNWIHIWQHNVRLIKWILLAFMKYKKKMKEVFTFE